MITLSNVSSKHLRKSVHLKRRVRHMKWYLSASVVMFSERAPFEGMSEKDQQKRKA